MIDALAAAASVVAFITPALVEIGRGGAKKAGETAAGDLLGWLRAKTTGQAREALTDLEREPTSADNQADLRKQLAKLFSQEPTLLGEVQSLLPAATATGDRLDQHVEGTGAKGAQIKGGGNTVTM